MSDDSIIWFLNFKHMLDIFLDFTDFDIGENVEI